MYKNNASLEERLKYYQLEILRYHSGNPNRDTMTLEELQEEEQAYEDAFPPFQYAPDPSIGELIWMYTLIVVILGIIIFIIVCCILNI